MKIDLRFNVSLEISIINHLQPSVQQWFEYIPIACTLMELVENVCSLLNIF